MPQYTEPPCGGQVLDIDTAIKDGILDGGVPDGICSGRGGCGGGGGVGGGNEKPVDLRKLMEEVMENGDEEPVPAVFICPISLEPMVDPVTLCTGQTYERGNIGKWLSLGHRTCPTTMQELWDEALTPNATLRQLIAAWFSRRYARFKKRSADFHGRAADLVADLRRGLKGQARVAALKDLRSLLASHPSVAKPIADAGGVALLSSLLGPFTSHAVGSEAVAILVSGLPLDVDARTSLMQPAKVSLVVDMLNEGTVDTKINCVRLIHILVDDEKGGGFRAESLSLLAGLMRLVRDRRRPDGVAAGIGLLSSICAAHEPVRKMVISIGSVPQLVELLSSSNTTSPECLEAALEILESLSSVPEGQAALKDCPATIPNAVRLLMRVSEACTRRALTVLWAVCRMSPEECAPAAVEAGLAAKLLLVIQSGCTPDLKQQASELLKLCSLNYTATLFISKCKLTRTIQ